METAVECRYRGRLIGWLEASQDGFLRYRRVRPMAAWEINYNNLLRNGAW
jgi:hypothetical protein